MFLEVENLQAGYGTEEVLHGVSLRVDEGEIVSILGANGAGKTTTFKALLGLISIDGGSIQIFDKNLQEFQVQDKQKLGVVLSDSGFSGYLTVDDIIPVLTHLYNSFDRSFFLQHLQKFGLPRSKKIREFPTGMKAKLKVLAAISHNPRLLILDEPMTGLDPNQLEEIRHLIKETGKKKTVLLSTHIMQEVEAICDRVIIINQGKIVADRPIGEICTHADEGMVLRVEFSPGSDTHWLSKSELFTHTSQQAPNCWRLTSPQGKDPREALFFEAAVRRCPIIALHTEVYQLEDIFHRYTQNFPAKPGKD